MITKLIIPVIDTESQDFHYSGRDLTREMYEDMVMDNFLSTNNQMNRFVDNIARGISNVRQNNIAYTSNVERDYPDIKYVFHDAEAFVLGAKKNEIDENFFHEHYNKGDMFIIILNINPNSMSGDAESEIRFWLDDSRMIQEDDTLDNKMKLKILPVRGLKIMAGEEEYILENCKVLQNYSDEKWKYKFAIIVEKLTKNSR